MRLIASENYASRAVMEASGSCLTNKYSEGYAKKRYYEGQQVIDKSRSSRSRAFEALRCDRRGRRCGRSPHHVQPYSGSPANLAVYLAFCQPGDVVMASVSPRRSPHARPPVSITGKYFKSVPYGVRREDHCIDLESAEARQEHKPSSSGWDHGYRAPLDFAAFRSIADEVVPLAADIAHIFLASSRPASIPPPSHRRRRDLHHAQDLPRPAWRNDLLQEGACDRDRQGRLSRLQADPTTTRPRPSPLRRARRSELRQGYANAVVDNAKSSLPR